MQEVLDRVFSSDKQDRGEVDLEALLEVQAGDLLPSSRELLEFLRSVASRIQIF